MSTSGVLGGGDRAARSPPTGRWRRSTILIDPRVVQIGVFGTTL